MEGAAEAAAVEDEDEAAGTAPEAFGSGPEMTESNFTMFSC